AEIVGRTPAACRQLASRARRTMRADAGAAVVPLENAEDRRVTEQFIAACSTGDLDALLGILDPDVSGEADLGGGLFRSERGSVDSSFNRLRGEEEQRGGACNYGDEPACQKCRTDQRIAHVLSHRTPEAGTGRARHRTRSRST